MFTFKSSMTPISLFWILLLVVGLHTACSIEPKDNSNTNTTSVDTTQNAPVTFDGEYYFTGKPNDREMMLRIMVKDKNINGSYYYTDEGKEVKVAGKLTSDTMGEMSEYDANGNVVASFNGTFNADGTANIVQQKAGETTKTEFTTTPLKDPAAYQPKQ